MNVKISWSFVITALSVPHVQILPEVITVAVKPDILLVQIYTHASILSNVIILRTVIGLMDLALIPLEVFFVHVMLDLYWLGIIRHVTILMNVERVDIHVIVLLGHVRILLVPTHVLVQMDIIWMLIGIAMILMNV